MDAQRQRPGHRRHPASPAAEVVQRTMDRDSASQHLGDVVKEVFFLLEAKLHDADDCG